MSWLNDPYWLAAISATQKLGAGHREIHTPSEFCNFDRRFLPLAYSEALATDQVTAFCCPKDDIDLVQRAVFDLNFERFRCVFANEVFVLFSADPSDKAQSDARTLETHLPYFREKLARYRAGLPIRQSRVNPRYPVAEIGRATAQRSFLSVNASCMNNFGDELIAAAVHAMMQQAMPDARLIVGEPSLDRTVSASVDGVIVGGGGFLYDLTVPSGASPRLELQNIANYFRYAFMAAARGIPVVFAGIGHQGDPRVPLQSDSRRYVAQALDRAAWVTTRDASSFQIVRGLLGDQADRKVRASVDLVFSFFDDDVFDRLSERSTRPGTVGFSGELLKYGPERSAVLVQYVRSLDAEPRLFIQANEDVDHADQIRNRRGALPMQLVDLRPMSTQDGLAAMSQVDAVVTTRFHGVVMAMLQGRPFVAMAKKGDKKHRLITEEFPELMPNLVLADSDDAAGLKDALGALSRCDLPRASKSKVRELQRRALEHVDLFRDIFGPKTRSASSVA